jgi:hypothetical protein
MCSFNCKARGTIEHKLYYLNLVTYFEKLVHDNENIRQNITLIYFCLVKITL